MAVLSVLIPSSQKLKGWGVGLGFSGSQMQFFKIKNKSNKLTTKNTITLLNCATETAWRK
jgi:hypothetical protein